MNSTDVVVEISQPDHICNLTGNTGLRKPKPHYTLVGLLLPGTHFTTVLPVVKYSQGSHNLRPSDIHPSRQGRSMFIYPMDRILLLGNLPGHHIVRAIDGSLRRIVPVTCRPDLPPWEGVVAAITTVIIGEVGMGVVDDLVAVAAEAAGLIMDSNLVFNRQ